MKNRNLFEQNLRLRLYIRGYEDRFLVIFRALRFTPATGIAHYYVGRIDPLELNLKKFEDDPTPLSEEGVGPVRADRSREIRPWRSQC